MAQYHVTLKAGAPPGEVRVQHVYVTAPDTKAGYRKAREKAEAKLAKQGLSGYRGVDVRCVG